MGTFVNREKIEANIEVALNVGDIIGIGCPEAQSTKEDTFVYRLLAPAASPGGALHQVEDTAAALRQDAPTPPPVQVSSPPAPADPAVQIAINQCRSSPTHSQQNASNSPNIRLNVTVSSVAGVKRKKESKLFSSDEEDNHETKKIKKIYKARSEFGTTTLGGQVDLNQAFHLNETLRLDLCAPANQDWSYLVMKPPPTPSGTVHCISTQH